MTEEELEQRVEQANTNWESATQGDPKDFTWGFFSYGDGPAGMGFGSFAWFPDRTSMFDFIANTLPYSPGGQATRDWHVVASDTSRIVEQLKAGQLSDREGITQLNAVLWSFSRIKWLGTFDELKTSNDEYACQVRRAFLDADDEDVTPDVVGPEQERAFREFLNGWGQ